MTPPHDVLPAVHSLPFARDLATFGDRAALITPEGTITYRDLAARVASAARRLGSHRRLILLAGANTVESLITYLAALNGGHPVLLAPGDKAEAIRSLVATYDPDIVARSAGGEWVLDERRPVSSHTFHPDLAVLLSTSGSTGSPKLVRLSHQNLQSNAESIATYLDIRPSDRAATTLPPHYCYGLSVVHSHLSRGAGLILTSLSVADSCFWELFRENEGTTFAGVPYTFELLDRVGFAHMDLPHLRYVTQAGGRLAPELVSRYATLGRRSGWDLFVMYGQTEATARMAYLPPELVLTHPHAIGVPVPGGSFRLQSLTDQPAPDTGELVYSGPNVMLGYAENPADLALGRTVEELYTGDIARHTSDGLYELVGRRSRFAKILGIRIDPQRIEALLERHGVRAYCVGGDDTLVVACVTDHGERRRIRGLVANECGLPPRAILILALTELPRLATGKPDYQAVNELARAIDQPVSPTLGGAGVDELCRLYAEILDRDRVTGSDTFVGLGGDSLSYVEMSLRLEKALGRLPAHWHTLTIRDLASRSTRRPSRRWRTVETGIALRALAIVLIVGSHIPVFTVKGGAHLLLGVAGFNFARFHLTSATRGERVKSVWTSIGRIAAPSAVWIALAMWVTHEYALSHVVLLNSVLGPHQGRAEFHFWFLEALVYFLVAGAACLAIPAVDRVERRFPFGLPMALATGGLVTRYNLLDIETRVHHMTPFVVFWLFALGWAAAKASTSGRRLLVTAAALATVPGLFPGSQPRREAIVMAGLVLLIWVPSLPIPSPLDRVAGVLAGSSLFIYLTHYQVYPHIQGYSPLLALIASLVFGIAYATVAGPLTRGSASLLRRSKGTSPKGVRATEDVGGSRR